MTISEWKRFFLACAFISLSACVATHSPEKSIIYKAAVFEEPIDEFVSDGYVDIIEINKDEGVVRYDGDRIVMQLLDCENREWKCISDGNMEFAIRRDWQGKNKSWSYRNITYSVIRELERPSAFREHRTYYILARPDGPLSEKMSPKVYLYSKVEGILGITKILQGRSGVVTATYIRVGS